MKAGEGEADVIVVGGGPAGASCARALAREGARVVLLHWGGYAVSGIELVSGRARHLMERSFPDFFQDAVQGVEIRETVSLWGTDEPITFHAPSRPGGMGIAATRPSLDKSLRRLAAEAGARVIEDAKAEEISQQKEGWRVLVRPPRPEMNPATPLGATIRDGDENPRFFARFLVLATGRAAGQFFHRVQLIQRPETGRIALTTLASAPDAAARALYIEAADNGWWHALPAEPGRYFIALCIERDALSRRTGPLKEYFMRELGATRLLGPLFRDAIFDGRALAGRNATATAYASIAGDRWLAVGDAAYAPDPICCGMGMELAIESGELGARALLPVLGKGGRHAGDFSSYEKSMRRIVERHARAAEHLYGKLRGAARE